MIWTFLIAFFLSVVAVPTLLLPTGDLPTDWDFSGFVHLYAYLNSFLPISETIEIVGLAIGVLAIIGSVYLVFSILGMILLRRPGS